MTYSIKIFFIVSMLLLNFAPTVQSAEQKPTEQKELWSGKLYTSTYTAGACINADGSVRGVLLLRLKNGKIDRYTFTGNKDAQGVFHLEHNSGHTFTGKFENSKTISGKVKTKNGYTVQLKGERTQNAPLGPRCQPLAI